MSSETFTQHLARLASLRDLAVGDHVRVTGSGRTGELVNHREDGGWNVRWDEPRFGCEVSRVATTNLERLES